MCIIIILIIMIKRLIEPIVVSSCAYNKMSQILKTQNRHAFLFYAKGGGCNGFNYMLETLNKDEYDNMLNEHKKLTIMENDGTKLIIEPMSEMMLLGTTIDYIKEDYSKNIFESKFVYKPDKDFATTCGCGVSFNPKI